MKMHVCPVSPTICPWRHFELDGEQISRIEMKRHLDEAHPAAAALGDSDYIDRLRNAFFAS
jgi:hypothetical protein